LRFLWRPSAKLLVEVVSGLRFLCRAHAKLLIEVVSGIEIFMQSSLLKYKLTVKVLAIFIQQVNHENILNGYS
jgi:hypothetical protein